MCDLGSKRRKNEVTNLMTRHVINLINKIFPSIISFFFFFLIFFHYFLHLLYFLLQPSSKGYVTLLIWKWIIIFHRNFVIWNDVFCKLTIIAEKIIKSMKIYYDDFELHTFLSTLKSYTLNANVAFKEMEKWKDRYVYKKWLAILLSKLTHHSIDCTKHQFLSYAQCL